MNETLYTADHLNFTR